MAKNSPISTNREACNAEEWKTGIIRTIRRKRVPLKLEVPLQNCFALLHTEEEGPVTLVEMLELTKSAQHAAQLRRRIITIGDSLQGGTETPICQPDPVSREVYCLPGTLGCHQETTEPILVH